MELESVSKLVRMLNCSTNDLNLFLKSEKQNAYRKGVGFCREKEKIAVMSITQIAFVPIEDRKMFTRNVKYYHFS